MAVLKDGVAWMRRETRAERAPQAIGWTAGLLLFGFVMLAEAAAAPDMPLPRPRPAEAPRADTSPSATSPSATPPRSREEGRAPAETPAGTPPPSDCRRALTEEIAIAPSIPAISGPGDCGGTNLVRLEAVVLSDRSRVVFKPPAILRCAMAAALADWIRTDLDAFMRARGAPPREIDNFDSYGCRGRNRVTGARLSEHGKANAIDIRGIRLEGDAAFGFTDRGAPISAREAVRASVCARFTTVLGPGSDWHHEDHIHLDLAERRNGFRICQWDIFEPAPADPPMPPERPADAPARASSPSSDAARETE